MTGTRRLPAAVLALALLALIGLAWRAQFLFQWGLPRAAGGWMLAGVTAAGLVVWLAAARWRGAAPAWQPSAAVEWAAGLGLGALAIGFRVLHFTSVPGGLNHDAAFNGMYALHVLQGAPYTPYVSAAWGRETLFMYLVTAFVAWFGNVAEPIPMASTLVGIATVALFYLLARALCGPRVALTALALLAVSGWHTLFSRVGWRMIMVPPFEIIALLGLWNALERGRWRSWALAGAGSALAIYTYDAGRVVPLMVAVLVGVFLLLERHRWRERLRGALLSLAVFLVVGAPMLWYAATHFEQFQARAAHLAVSEHPSLWHAAAAAIGMFNYRGNGNDFFVNEPLLGPLSGALFALSAVLTLTLLRRRAVLFIWVGLVMALLPGVLSSPNGNRCIAALPFVYLIMGLGVDAIAAVVTAPIGDTRLRRGAVVALVAALVAIVGVETYREFLGANRRPVIGFSPEATAAGEYMRQFGDAYSRYVVAEDWPEYTLAYLSYNGGGTPLENHYVLGRRLEEIEDRINRYGRKGLVFITDLKPAGQSALNRLQRLFEQHRVEPILAARLGGMPVGTALIVEPQSAGRTGLWSNTTRALVVGGEERAAALRCFAPPLGDAGGVSIRFQLMLPDAGAVADGEDGVALLAQCPPGGAAKPLLAVGFGRRGLELRAGGRALIARAADALEAGRWYEIIAVLHRDGRAEAWIDGSALPATPAPAVAGARPPRLAGLSLQAGAGARFFVDDLTIIAGAAPPGDAHWAAAPGAGGLREDFETTPYGRLAAGDVWQRVDGPLSALASPAPSGGAPAAAAAVGGNAFDGGRGSEPGQFNQPVGISVAPDGSFFVADKNNHRVQKFLADGELVRAWGGQGNQAGEFREPHDVATDGEFVYVADTWNQRVQVFDRDGRHVFTITGQPSMSSPRGVFAHDKQVYVAEAGGGRVAVYDRAGALRRTYGTLGGDALGHLVEPVDAVVDSRGEVWVVNGGNNRLEHFAADGTPIDFIRMSGWTGGGLKEVHLAIDADDVLYVGDWNLNAVRRFQRDGRELPALGSAIDQPSGLAVTGDRRLLAVARADDVVRVIPLQQNTPAATNRATRGAR